METEKKTAVLSRDLIKYFAMITMLLNHAAIVFLKGSVLYPVLEAVGYFTAPVMCYFLVEGYHYTRSKKKYGGRLLLFALISQLPYDLAFHFGNLNMLFTLFVCFLILVAGEKIENPTILGNVRILLVLLTAVGDWSFVAACCTLMLENAWGDRRRILRSYLAVYFIFAGFLFLGSLPVYNISEAAKAVAGALLSGVMILAAALTVCYLYNGKRAVHCRKFSQWFFYIFYPAHLMLLAAIRDWI